MNQPDPEFRHLTNLPKTDKMDAKFYCLTAASNTTLVFKDFPMNKGNENGLALPWGPALCESETPERLHTPPPPKPLLSETFQEFLHHN